jgi:ribose 5-phosphate isomerase A
MTTKPSATLDREKRLVAAVAVDFVRDGMRIGLGSGSTAQYFIRALGERLSAGTVRVEAIATSMASEHVAAEVGIPLIGPRRGLELDLTIDGADEIDPKLNLIKGRGGALLREKVIARASRCLLIIADSSKQVATLGQGPIPVEVVPFALPWVEDRIEEMGGTATLRGDAGEPWKTDQGNFILDCRLQPVPDLAMLDDRLANVPGVVGHGLFLGLATIALIADGEQVRLMRPGLAPAPLGHPPDLG